MTGTPISLTLKKVATLGLAVNPIHFVTKGSFGHRVQIGVAAGTLATMFTWTRAVDASVPVAVFNGNMTTVGAMISAAITGGFVDLDKNVNGLNFTTADLVAANPALQSPAGSPVNSVNDLVMAFLMYRCFGTSTSDKSLDLYNIEDGYNMISDTNFITAVADLLNTNSNPTLIDSLFRDQLTQDPARYLGWTTGVTGTMFDVSTGTGTDAGGSGPWNFLVGDVIEFPIRMVFRSPVTLVNSLLDDTLQSTAPNNASVITGEAATWSDANVPYVAPSPLNVINLRLQLVAM